MIWFFNDEDIGISKLKLYHFSRKPVCNKPTLKYFTANFVTCYYYMPEVDSFKGKFALKKPDI
jgi:hypothetical protein